MQTQFRNDGRLKSEYEKAEPFELVFVSVIFFVFAVRITHCRPSCLPKEETETDQCAEPLGENAGGV